MYTSIWNTTDQMSVLVSSTKGANGDGYGAVLAFDLAGNLLGTFCEDNRITDPRGLCVDPTGDLLYVNSGNDRILALDRKRQIRRERGARSTGSTPEVESSGPTAATTLARVGSAQSWPYRQAWTGPQSRS